MSFKKTEDLKSLVFDLYFFEMGKTKSGEIRCRQSGKRNQFNDYDKEKQTAVYEFIENTLKEYNNKI